MASTAPSVIALIDRPSPAVAIVRLNRPEARNALNVALVERLLDVISALSEEQDLRVMILTGDDTFCAGADLRERTTMSADARTRHTDLIAALAEEIAQFPVPVIAAIKGYALAGGFELALACDMRIAASNAVMGLPEVKIGIFPGAGAMLRLPRLVGAGTVKELIFTGRNVEAAEAFELGLVDRVVAPEQLRSVTLELAQQIAANAPLAVRAAKRALNESEGLAGSAARDVVRMHRRSLDHTRDYDEGLSAFANRRKPNFIGK